MKRLLYILLFFPVVSHAQLPDWRFAVHHPAASPPSLSLSPTSLTLTGSAGTAGTPATTFATFANLTGNVTQTIPTNTIPIEVSIDNGITYSASAHTFNSGSPVGVKARVASTATVASGTDTIQFATAGVTSIKIPVSVTVTSPSVADSMFIMFDTTSTPPSGWVQLRGDPHFANKSVTNASGLITASTLAVNYVAYSGACAFPNNGNTGATGLAPAAVMNEFWYQSTTTLNTAKPQITITGLKTDGTTYTFTMSASETFASSNVTTSYEVIGAATYGPTNFSIYNNTTNVATFTVTPDGTGTAKVYWNTATGTDNLAGCAFLKIKSN